MDDLYLENIDEFVNDHNKIVSEILRILTSSIAITVCIVTMLLFAKATF